MSDKDDDFFKEDNSFAGYGLDKFGRVTSINPNLPPEERLRQYNRLTMPPKKRRGVAPISDQEIMTAFNLSPAAYRKLSAEQKLRFVNQLSHSKAQAKA